jgi:hypothetical protein
MKRCWRGVQISHLQLRIAMKRRSSVGATFWRTSFCEWISMLLKRISHGST